MTKKFTEEQYQKIVEIADDFEENGGLGILDTLNRHTIGDRLFVTDLAVEIEFKPNSGVIMALANPLTREWAYDKFVEKEKRYVWKLNGLYLVKAVDDGSIFFGSSDAAMALSESQIKEWGFNPKMFNKEEV